MNYIFELCVQLIIENLVIIDAGVVNRTSERCLSVKDYRMKPIEQKIMIRGKPLLLLSRNSFLFLHNIRFHIFYTCLVGN